MIRSDNPPDNGVSGAMYLFGTALLWSFIGILVRANSQSALLIGAVTAIFMALFILLVGRPVLRVSRLIVLVAVCNFDGRQRDRSAVHFDDFRYRVSIARNSHVALACEDCLRGGCFYGYGTFLFRRFECRGHARQPACRHFGCHLWAVFLFELSPRCVAHGVLAHLLRYLDAADCLFCRRPRLREAI